MNITLERKNISTFFMFLGLSLIVPSLYHVIGMKGTVFLPIFLPLIMASKFIDKKYLIMLAIGVPLINNLLFGMPPGPVMIEIMVEGLVFSLLTTKNVFYRFAAARLSSAVFIILYPALTASVWASNVVAGIPGIILNCLIALFLAKSFDKE